jgi:DNA polymerase-1
MIFCGGRACSFWELGRIFSDQLKEKNLSSIYFEIDAPLIPVLAQMEGTGVSIDIDYFQEMQTELEDAIESIESSIKEYTDGDDINLNSPKQVGELLFNRLELPVIKKTKTGFSTDVEVLEKLDRKKLHPIPGLLLRYREVSKLLSTYVKTIPTLVHANTKRVHTHFNQHVAATGRLASNNPNLQNIPIRTELGRKVRKGFVPQKGWSFLGADYSQVELRILAHMSGDQTMIDAFKKGVDIHRQTASEVMGVPINEVTSEERSKAKAVNFGLMYGQSSFGLAAQLGISRKEAKDYITRYFERFSQVKSFLDGLKEKAEKDGYVETLHGRKRFLPDIHSKNRTIKANAERVAINSPIQGTAADIIKLAMLAIDKKLREENLEARMLLQVHDELIFEAPEQEVEKLMTIVKEGMENVVELVVPLTVDANTGENWFELK